jgi:TFIIF-interacting CTD phosphatase-like protein
MIKVPRAREMLEDLKSTFTMYIYTMGTKAYAEEVKKILDPCGVIFGKRSEPMRHTRPQHQTLIKTQAGGH